MGVHNIKFIMYGVEVSYNEYMQVAKDDDGNYDEFDEKYDLAWDKDDKMPYGFIADGMGGQYAVFGTVLARYDEDYGEQMPTGVIELNKIFKDYKLTAKRKSEVKRGVEKILGREVKLKKLLVNHYH